MTTIGMIGAGEVGSNIARAAISSGYEVVIANSRVPETLGSLVEELGPSARAATAAEAAAEGDFVVVAVPLKPLNDMPAAETSNRSRSPSSQPSEVPADYPQVENCVFSGAAPTGGAQLAKSCAAAADQGDL